MEEENRPLAHSESARSETRSERGEFGLESSRLSINSPEDLLGYLPHVLGYWPENSLMVLVLDQKQAGASLRLNLPRRYSSEEELSNYARHLVSCLGAAGAAKGSGAGRGVVLALFTGMEWQDHDDPGYDHLMSHLLRALDTVGMPVREAWWVGQKTWRNYLCRNESCCPGRGRPVHELRESRLSTELIYRGSTYSPDLTTAVRGYPLPRSRQLEVLRGFTTAIPGLSRAQPGGEMFARALENWDLALRPGTEQASEEAQGSKETKDKEWAEQGQQQGVLLAALSNTALRDAILMLVLTETERPPGHDVKEVEVEEPRKADESALVDSALAEPAPVDSAPVDSVPTPHSGLPEQRSSAYMAGAYGRSADSANLVLGGSDYAPDWERLDRFKSVLLILIGLEVPPEQKGGALGRSRAAALCLLAWTEWCRGRGSTAAAFLAEARSTLPGYRLTQLLTDLLASGLRCPWSSPGARKSPSARRPTNTSVKPSGRMSPGVHCWVQGEPTGWGEPESTN